jgi:hypothetical protein
MANDDEVLQLVKAVFAQNKVMFEQTQILVAEVRSGFNVLNERLFSVEKKLGALDHRVSTLEEAVTGWSKIQ